MRTNVKCPRSVKAKCPNCGSYNVVCEAEVTIRFMFSKEGKYEIISEWDNFYDEIFWGTPYECECQDCNEIFMFE